MEGSEIEFRNIEGCIGDVHNKPAVVITAHYDTVPTAPGANDDAVGVATMLEIARVLAKLENPPPVYFVAVTLEENNNPKLFNPTYESLLARGVKDKNHFFTGWKIKKDYEKVTAVADGVYFQGGSWGEGYRKALDEFGESLDEKVRLHFEDIIPLYMDVNIRTALGYQNRIGSYQWLQEALKENKQIAFNITLDEMGFYLEGELTQRDLAGINVYNMMCDSHKVDAEKRIGNFLLLASNIGSKNFGEKLSEKFKLEDVDMPFGHVNLPFDFEQVIQHMPMALQSDHAGFWKHNIPALFLFDSAMARNPYGHSYGDTINILDFDKIEQAAKGITALLCDEGVIKR
jgi:hypothetical protein